MRFSLAGCVLGKLVCCVDNIRLSNLSIIVEFANHGLVAKVQQEKRLVQVSV
jgi:hypothetical protein